MDEFLIILVCVLALGLVGLLVYLAMDMINNSMAINQNDDHVGEVVSKTYTPSSHTHLIMSDGKGGTTTTMQYNPERWSVKVKHRHHVTEIGVSSSYYETIEPKDRIIIEVWRGPIFGADIFRISNKTIN